MALLVIKKAINTKDCDKPKVQTVPPKHKPPSNKEYGNYCIRSDVYIRQNNESGKLLGRVSGMSSDWDIIPKTVNYCQTVKNGRVKRGYCTEPIVKVERWHEDCDGNVSLEKYS